MKKYKLTTVASYTGYIVQAFVNNFLPLLYVIFNAPPYGVKIEQLGALSFINFTLQLIVDVLSVYLVPKFGSKRCVVTAQGLSALGFLCLAVLPNLLPIYPAVLVSMLFLSLGSGLIEVVVSPIIEALPNRNKSGSMSLLHSFYSWGQVLAVAGTTLLLLVLGNGRWQLIAALWALLPAVNTFLFYKAPILELPAEHTAPHGAAILKDRGLWLFLIVILCAGASEITMVQWSSFFVQTGFGLQKWVCDLLGPCAFAVLMGLGRVLFGLIGDRIRLDAAIFGCGLLCLACYLTVAFSSNALLSLITCAVCGFAVSVMWPGTYSLAAKHYGGGTTQMFGFLAMAGDLGCGFGPVLLTGLTALAGRLGLDRAFARTFHATGEQAGMQLGFLATSVFPLVMILCTAALMKKKNSPAGAAAKN